MADPFRKGIAAHLGWRLSIGATVAVFVATTIGVIPPLLMFPLIGIGLIVSGIFHHVAEAKVPAFVRGSRDPLDFQLTLIIFGVIANVIEFTILTRARPQVVFVAFGLVLIGLGLLTPLACRNLSALARFKDRARDVRLHFVSSGVMCILGIVILTVFQAH
jgi:hypothetical protein